jgi:hypothetical protein
MPESRYLISEKTRQPVRLSRRIISGTMDDLTLDLSESELKARLNRIARNDEPFSTDIGADTVLLLIRLNLAVDELTRTVRDLARQNGVNPKP